MIFCSLYSGSSGNCIFVSSGNTKILIDAGMSGKSIENALAIINQSPSEIDAIFVTHEHIDHVKGVGVLSRRYDIPIYANEPTFDAMANCIGRIADKNRMIIDSRCISINDMDIINYDIPHDAACPFGYSIHADNKKVCIATDLGHFTEEVRHSIEDADVLLLESNHDIEMLKFGPYPYTLKKRILSDVGHLSNEACGNAIVKITNDKHKNIILGHLSKTNNYPDLAYQTVVNILTENGIKLNSDITLTMAKRNEPSSYIEF